MFLARKIRLAYEIFIVLLIVGLSIAEPAQQLSAAPDVQEELIGEKGPDTSPSDREDRVSRDGKRVAWRDKRGKKWVLVVDGKKIGAEYKEIKWIVFSPDGQQVAHLAKAEKRWTMVLDGQGSPQGSPGVYKEAGYPRFSPDSQHLAYKAKKDKKWLVVLNSKEGPVYDEVDNPVFSPDNQHLIYAAKRQKKWVVVVDGKEQETEMDRGWDVLAFTPNTHEPIYVGWSPNGGSVFVGGQPGPEFDIISRPAFYPDNRRFVYAGALMKKPAFKRERAVGQVVVDGMASTAYEGLPLGVPLFKAALHVDELKRDSFAARAHGVSSPSVSPNGEQVAYTARNGDKDYVVIRNGDVGRSFENIPCNPTFGTDGRLVYVGVEGDTLVVMVDGERLNEFVWAGVDDCSIITFTEGNHFIYSIAQGGMQYDDGVTSRAERRVFVDGEAGKEYDAWAVGNFQTLLSGEELHLAYEVHDDKYNDHASFVVVDGLDGKHYDSVMGYSLQFSGEKTVSYIARRERKFYRVTQSFR